MKHWTLILVIALSLMACNSTQREGERNPAHAGYQLTQRTIVSVEGEAAPKIEVELVERLRKAGVDAVSARQVGKWAESQQDYQRVVEEQGILAAVFVNVGGASAVNTVGVNTNSHGTATSYGNTASYSGSSTSTPIIAVSRDMAAAIEVRACADSVPGGTFGNCALVWRGTTKRHAQGLAFTGTGSMVGHTVDAILDSIDEDGLIKSKN